MFERLLLRSGVDEEDVVVWDWVCECVSVFVWVCLMFYEAGYWGC